MAWRPDFITGLDFLFGESGNDVVTGGEGVDTLYGGSGNDRIDGGIGKDALYGGNNGDTFVLLKGGSQDAIYDFNQYQGDRIALDHTLWTGSLTATQVVKTYGSMSDGDLRLTFAKGDQLTIEHFTDISTLSKYIDII